jgi:hypothetical protein
VDCFKKKKRESHRLLLAVTRIASLLTAASTGPTEKSGALVVPFLVGEDLVLPLSVFQTILLSAVSHHKFEVNEPRSSKLAPRGPQSTPNSRWKENCGDGSVLFSIRVQSVQVTIFLTYSRNCLCSINHSMRRTTLSDYLFGIPRAPVTTELANLIILPLSWLVARPLLILFIHLYIASHVREKL